MLSAAVASGLVAGLAARRRGGTVQGAVAAMIAFDLTGGMVAFHQPATRCVYARRNLAARLLFTGMHAHPFLLAMTGQGTWKQALCRYLEVNATTAALELLVPRSRIRPVLATVIAVLLAGMDWRNSPGQQNRWLGPVFLLKLISGHAGIPRERAHDQGQHP